MAAVNLVFRASEPSPPPGPDRVNGHKAFESITQFIRRAAALPNQIQSIVFRRKTIECGSGSATARRIFLLKQHIS